MSSPLRLCPDESAGAGTHCLVSPAWISRQKFKKCVLERKKFKCMVGRNYWGMVLAQKLLQSLRKCELWCTCTLFWRVGQFLGDVTITFISVSLKLLERSSESCLMSDGILALCKTLV